MSSRNSMMKEGERAFKVHAGTITTFQEKGAQSRARLLAMADELDLEGDKARKAKKRRAEGAEGEEAAQEPPKAAVEPGAVGLPTTEA